MLGSRFRLDDDAIWDGLTARSDKLRPLHERHGHVRLRQQPDRWEYVVAYICSAKKSVEAIRNSVDKVAEVFGERIDFHGDVRHTFPTVACVLKAGEKGLEGLRLGLEKDRTILAVGGPRTGAVWGAR